MTLEKLTFGEALRRLRVSRGLSQSKLAVKLKVDSTYVSHIERGKREPSFRLVREMSEALEVPAVSLLAIAMWEDLPQDQRAQFGEWVTTLGEGFDLLATLEE